MYINFRQGIIKHPLYGNEQAFLQRSVNGIDLLTENGSILLNFSHGNSNYLFEELQTIPDAWIGSFDNTDEYWLYWDIDTLSGNRTFGYTTIVPLISANKPSNPQTGQHWYDLVNNKMFVFETAIWRNVIRVFACYYDGLNFSSMSNGIGNFSYAGSQVGISNVQAVSGKILFTNNKPILNQNKEFLTTETVFHINGTNIESLRLDSVVNVSKANETIPKFHVVKYLENNKIELANYADSDSSILGITSSESVINELVNVFLDGVITNPEWNFSHDIGTDIWVKDNGELSFTDPHLTDNIAYPKQYRPIAKVFSSDSIMFNPVYPLSQTVNVEFTPATTTELGAVKLLTNSSDSVEPIVITDTDSRLTDDRNPLPHIHNAVDVPSSTSLVSTNVNDSLEELNSNKANLSGATFTGDVQVIAPVNTNSAVPKQYVDDLVNGLTWIEPIQFINVISNTSLNPPIDPEYSDTYIIPSSSTPTGLWNTFTNNDIIQWDGENWILLDNLTNISLARFGISFTTITPPSGTFLSKESEIAIYDNGVWSFETPSTIQAVLVNSINDIHAYHQFVYNTKWIEFAGPHDTIPGTNLYKNDNVIHVKQVSDGGTIDALTLNGFNDTDLVKVSGDTMAGPLVLQSDPVNPLEAATKQYVDNLSISDLSDVDSVLSPIDDDVLYFDAVNNLWKSKQITIASNGSGSPYTFITLTGTTIEFH